MTDRPINLNRVRKTRARDQAKRLADTNAVTFGRSKAERAQDAATRARADKRLDDHNLGHDLGHDCGDE